LADGVGDFASLGQGECDSGFRIRVEKDFDVIIYAANENRARPASAGHSATSYGVPEALAGVLRAPVHRWVQRTQVGQQ
jgi:hypothetical protein